MENDDCDLFSIVNSYKATTSTSPTTIFENVPPPQTLTTTTTTTTNNIISPQNTSPFYLDDFSLTQENRSDGFSPLKPTDFIELDKLKTNSSLSTVISSHTTTIPIIATPTTTILTTPTTITTTTISVPIHISTTTIANTIHHDFNQNSNFFDFPTLPGEQQMQPTNITRLGKSIPNFNPTSSIPIPTINTTIIPTSTTSTFTNPNLPTMHYTPSDIITTPPINTMIHYTPSDITTTPPINTMINADTRRRGTNNYSNIYNFPTLFEQEVQQNHINHVRSLKPPACIEITTAHFDLAYNHPSISKQYPRECNQLPILQPQTSSEILPNTDPEGEQYKQRKRKFDDQKIVEWHLSVEKLGDDPWEWRKNGQKPIKGSPNPRNYYICNTSKDCSAKRHVEKKLNKENIYIVTYIGEHNHPKPDVDRSNSFGSPQNKSSKKRLSNVKKCGSSRKIKNSDSRSTMMPQFDQAECSNAQFLRRQSKVSFQEIGPVSSPSPATREVASSLNVENLDSPNLTMLQVEHERNNA